VGFRGSDPDENCHNLERVATPKEESQL